MMIINKFFIFFFLLKIKKAKNIKQKRIKRAIIMMLYCRYQALFDLNLISLPNDDIRQHNAQACAPVCRLIWPAARCSQNDAGPVASAPRPD